VRKTQASLQRASATATKRKNRTKKHEKLLPLNSGNYRLP